MWWCVQPVDLPRPRKRMRPSDSGVSDNDNAALRRLQEVQKADAMLTQSLSQSVAAKITKNAKNYMMPYVD